MGSNLYGGGDLFKLFKKPLEFEQAYSLKGTPILGKFRQTWCAGSKGFASPFGQRGQKSE